MNKSILVTGGTGTLGCALISPLLESGWEVVITSRTQSNIDKLISNTVSTKKSLLGIAVDFKAPGAVEYLLNKLIDLGISITHLVNNARSLSTLAVNSDGVSLRDNFIGEFTMDVVIPYELTMGFANSLQHSLRNVVNIGSMYGEVAPTPYLYNGSLHNSPIQYGVSKAGLHHLTKELAVRLAPKNIRVNCVAYGGIEGRVDDEFVKRYSKLTPAGRMLKHNEVFGPVDFLINEGSSAINGHILVADGGWSIW